MRRSPPDLLVTTPESLYLLLTAASSRAMLRDVRTVIVDEVHTLARDKRGSHLALSLERLAKLVEAGGGRLQRIGLSATQRPLEVVARLLSGGDPTRRADHGHRLRSPARPRRRHRAARRRARGGGERWPVRARCSTASPATCSSTAPRSSSSTPARWPSASPTSWPSGSRTTERGAPPGTGRLRTGRSATGEPPARAARSTRPSRWPPTTAASRRRAGGSSRQRLRAGDLRALVATASLELGIDVGPVELVCQIGSPRAIGTFLQRVGRANHQLEGTPGRPALPADPRRAGRVHRPAGRRPGRPPRPPPAAGGPARRPGPADRGRGGRGRGVRGRRALRAGAPGRALRRARPDDLRRGGRAGLVGHQDRPRPAGRPPAPRRRSTDGCGPARGAGWPP